MEGTSRKLNDAEARVLGVLIEKSLTTPDSYPLSINALINASNQKSNRHPVVNFVEAEVLVALQGLVPKHLACKVMEAGSRVEKFRHTALGTLRLEAGPLAILTELMLRGPQPKGELRARAHRMIAMPEQTDLAAHLEILMERELVRTLPPKPGSRATRYVQLLAPDLHAADEAAVSTPVARAAPAADPAPAAQATPLEPGLNERVTQLEKELADLRAQVDSILEELT